MRLDIKVNLSSEVPDISRHAERRALLEFGRFGERVASVAVRVMEGPPTAGAPYHCGIAVRVIDDGGTSNLVIAHGQDNDVVRAVDAAIGRAGIRTGGEIARADEARRVRLEWMSVRAAARGVET